MESKGDNAVEPDSAFNELVSPFRDYPDHGRKRLGLITGDNCRHGYGRIFQQITGQYCCAYCGLNLIEQFENWLTMALDHVVPQSICNVWGIPNEWKNDYSNCVLSCTACNTFGNKYTPKNVNCPTSIDEFYDLRDTIFLERKALIHKRRQIEEQYFEGQPWKKKD